MAENGNRQAVTPTGDIKGSFYHPELNNTILLFTGQPDNKRGTFAG